jgi:hypothetical protein
MPPTATTAAHRSAPRPEWAALVKKAADHQRLTVTALLTYPQVDLDGEVVDPAGGTWAANPYVNVEHDPACVVGTGAVAMKAVRVGNETLTLPFGTTTFRDDHLGRQAFRLVAEDVLSGVSLEFEPLARTPIGKSLLRGRTAYRYDRWRGLGWAHCAHPINPDARTLPDSVGKALGVLRDGRLAGAPLDPVIRKALSPYLAASRSVTVRVGKSMDYDDPMAAPPVDATAPADAPMPDEAAPEADDTPPTAKAAYDAAQALTDAAQMIRDAVQRSEHLKGKAKLVKLADSLEADAAEASAVGDMVMSDVGGDEPEPDADAPADEPGADAPADDAPPESDEEKEEKSFSRFIKPIRKAADGSIQTRTGYAPRRFRLADLSDPDPVAKAGGPTPDQLAELAAEKRRSDKIRRQLGYAKLA